MEELSRKERIKKRAEVRKKIRVIILISVLLIITLLVLTAFDSMKTMLNLNKMKTAVVEEGRLEETISAEVVVIRDEETIAVPNSREYHYLFEEGERVREGMILADGNRRLERLKATTAGVISYDVDGYESVLSPKKIESLKLEEVYDEVLTDNDSSLENGNEIKIIDNLNPVFLLFLVDVQLPEEDGNIIIKSTADTYRAEIVENSSGFYLVKLSHTPDEFMNERVSSVEIVIDREWGNIIPVSALTGEGDTCSVLKSMGGQVKKIDVELKGIFDDKAVVEGVDSGEEIITNPDIFNQGGSDCE